MVIGIYLDPCRQVILAVIPVDKLKHRAETPEIDLIIIGPDGAGVTKDRAGQISAIVIGVIAGCRKSNVAGVIGIYGYSLANPLLEIVMIGGGIQIGIERRWQGAGIRTGELVRYIGVRQVVSFGKLKDGPPRGIILRIEHLVLDQLVIAVIDELIIASIQYQGLFDKRDIAGSIVGKIERVQHSIFRNV